MTTNSFFSKMTIEEAQEAVAEAQEKFAQAEAACDRGDWFALEALDLAHRVDGPQYGTYRWEFRRERARQLRETAGLTAIQYMERYNQSLDRDN